MTKKKIAKQKSIKERHTFRKHKKKQLQSAHAPIAFHTHLTQRIANCESRMRRYRFSFTCLRGDVMNLLLCCNRCVSVCLFYFILSLSPSLFVALYGIWFGSGCVWKFLENATFNRFQRKREHKKCSSEKNTKPQQHRTNVYKKSTWL